MLFHSFKDFNLLLFFDFLFSLLSDFGELIDTVKNTVINLTKTFNYGLLPLSLFFVELHN
jgi:hypothetical protein